MGRWRLPVRDRILLHLFDYLRYRDSFESPLEVTQAGIAEAVGIRARHASQYLKPLVSEGMVEVETRHVLGQPRRRKVYFLTAKGRGWVVPARDALFRETVPFKRTDSRVERVPLRDVYLGRRRGDSLLQLIQEVASLGFLSEAGGGSESGLVDFSQEAPRTDSFHGREAELDAVLDALGETPLVVIRGMAGLGKTALGSRVCERVRGERSLFWRRIRPWDTAFDLASRVGIFLEALGRSGLHTYLSGSKRRSLSRVEDLLATDLAGLQTVLVFDDAHVASEDAEALLALLWNALREVGGSSALLLTRIPPEFYSRRAVAVEGGVCEIPLRPLDRGSGEALLADAGVPPDHRGRLYDLSGGNPLFLRLVAETGVPSGAYDGWETLQAYIAEEVAPLLDVTERGCLQVASLFELPVPPEALLQEDRGDLGTVLGLQRKGLLDELDDGTAILHDSLREYFRRGLPPERRETLVDRVVPWLLREAEEAATKSRGGSRRLWLAPSRRAREVEAALGYLGNALLLDDRRDRRARSLERVGDFRGELGDFVGAVKALREALDLAEQTTARARLHRKVAHCQVLLLRPEEARREIDAGLRIAGPEPSIEGAWLLSIRAFAKFHDLQDYAGAWQDVREALGWLPSLPEDVALRGMLESQMGALYHLDPDRYDPRAAQGHFEATLACAEAREATTDIAAAHRVLGNTLLERGDLEGAKAHFEEAGNLAEETGEYLSLITQAWFLAECLGDFDRAEELYQRGLEMMDTADVPEHALWYDRLLADLFLRTGRHEEARELLGYFLERGEGLLNVYRRVENLALMARVCLRCEDLEGAERYVREAEAHRRGTDSAWLDFHVAWAAGLLEAAEGDVSSAEARLGRLQEPGVPEGRRGLMFELLSTHFARGEFLLDYGLALFAAGRKERAAEVLMEAQKELAREGRKPLEREATEALRALGPAAS